MKLYRYDISGVSYTIVDNEDGAPVVVQEIADARDDRPRNINGRIYRALHMLNVWRASGKPGEVLK